MLGEIDILFLNICW